MQGWRYFIGYLATDRHRDKRSEVEVSVSSLAQACVRQHRISALARVIEVSVISDLSLKRVGDNRHRDEAKRNRGECLVTHSRRWDRHRDVALAESRGAVSSLTQEDGQTRNCRVPDTRYQIALKIEIEA